MNPFQRAREEANALRVELLGDRAGLAVHANELLGQIEPKLNLGVERLPKGSSELCVGDACLYRDERYIYLRNDLNEDQQAALIAHELGHWVLDVDKTQQTIASLALLANAQGSPGVVKVEAYGARERQELQANVFGREFLLPRHIALALFESGSGPNKVAADLSIPLSIVQQQMLDAMLLPKVKTESSKILHSPSDDQKKAACAGERFVNVVAGPGTGKTSTLIQRVKFLVEELGVDPSHILVLTFTNKAAFELVERLRSTGLPQAADIWAGTFHGFGLEFLRKYHDAFGLPNDLLVADNLNSITTLARALPKITLQRYLRIEDPYEWLGGVIKGICRLKEELITPKQYREGLAHLQCGNHKLSLLRQDVATLYEVHDQLLHDAGLVDFADLVAIPANAIRDDRARFSELSDKFQYILVDEYQDVTKAMVELIIQLAKNAKSLWVVGDVRQAIHHWRGASVKSLLKFEQQFSEQAKSNNSKIQKYPLKLNRRSSQEIVDFISAAGECHVLQKSLPLDITVSASGDSGHKPLLFSCQSSSAIPEAVAETIMKLNAEGIPFSQQGVLCRRTADVEFLADRLREQGIPTLYIGELTNRPTVKKLLCLMHLLAERQPRALIGLSTNSDLRMPLVDIHKMLDFADQNLDGQRGRWLGKSVDGLSTEANQVIQTLANLLKGQNYYSNPWNFVCDILLEHRFGFPPLSDQSIDAQIERLAVWQFAYSVRAGDGDGKRPSIARYLLRRQLRQRIGENFLEREMPIEAAELNAVRIQTVHGSKGLEYQAVHIGYVNDSYSEKKPWQPEEDIKDITPPEVLGSSIDEYEVEQAIERNNLFYVAVSRAKTHLHLYEDGTFSYKNRPPQLAYKPQVYQEVSFNSAPIKSPAAYNNQGVLPSARPLSFEQFETYVRCPLQYWYRFVLNLKREQEYEAPVRARFAVMNLLKSIASGKIKNELGALEKAWQENALPSKTEDPTLWRDALTVFQTGIGYLNEAGTFLEPVTNLGGLEVCMPWVMKRAGDYGDIYKVIRFSPRGAHNMQTLLRPMIFCIDKNIKAELVNLVSDDQVLVEASKRIDSTKAMIAANKFQAENCQPTAGTHCKYCSYNIICPTNPQS